MMTLDSYRDDAAGGESVASADDPRLRAPVAMVVAHPGHELLSVGWLAKLRPSVFVVTDGSGRDSGPRIDATAKLLSGELGGQGSVFGRWTDRELYDALFEGRFEAFIELRDELADAWCRGDIRTVICDAYERRILMHDVVQLAVSAAVVAVRTHGRSIEFFESPIYCEPPSGRSDGPARPVSVTLSEEELRRKVAIAREYDSEVVQHEVDAFLGLRGEEGFRSEVLFPSIPRTSGDLEREPKPAWEKHGERLVEQGVYDRVIRLREHVVPLVRALECTPWTQ